MLAGLILAAFASYLAFRSGMLNVTGAAASTVLGTIVFSLGGWQWAVLLLLFFFTSSVLSKAYARRKLRYGEDYAKGDRRDAGQVAANGAVAATFVLLHLAFPRGAWPWIGFAGALAAANADTWATELGVLSGLKPRLITHPSQRVEPGTSGGISVAGTLAALGGSALIAVCTRVLDPGVGWLAVGAIAMGGLLGGVSDSLLGATIQAIYFCPVDQHETEQHPAHSCGSPTTQVRGWTWLNNDWVNAACTAAGGTAACLLSAALATL